MNRIVHDFTDWRDWPADEEAPDRALEGHDFEDAEQSDPHGPAVALMVFGAPVAVVLVGVGIAWGLS